MAIGTYSELTAEIAAYLARPLAGISNRVDNAIALFEASFNNTEAAFVQQTDTTLTTASGTALYALPADCGEIVSLGYQTAVKPILATSVEWMQQNDTGYQGAPERFATYPGSRVKLWPTPDGEYNLSLIYVRKVPALTSGAPTNWLLTSNPQLYLYGALAFLLDYVQDFERAASVKSIYAMLLSEYRNNSTVQSFGLNPIMSPEAGLP